jgi:hypothetical protein
MNRTTSQKTPPHSEGEERCKVNHVLERRITMKENGA